MSQNNNENNGERIRTLGRNSYQDLQNNNCTNMQNTNYNNANNQRRVLSYLNTINTNQQIIEHRGNIIFADNIFDSGTKIIHNTYTPNIILKGVGIFNVSLKVNVSIPTTGYLSPILLELLLDSTFVPATELIITPNALGEFCSLSLNTLLYTNNKNQVSVLSVLNISEQEIICRNAILVIEELY